MNRAWWGALAAVLLAILVGAWLVAAQPSAATRWEYFTLTASVRDTDFRAKLNAQGDAGWELVTWVALGEFQAYIFKRPLP